MHRACVGVWIGLVLLPACVTRATHQATLDQLDAARGELQEAQRRAEERTAERDGCVRERAAGEAERRAELERLTGEIRAADERAAEEERRRLEMAATMEGMSARIDEASEAGRACRSVLEETRRVAERSLGQNRDLTDRLDRLRAVEEEMRRLQSVHADLVRSFQGLIDAGQLEVRLDRGRLVLQLPQDVLFDSGKADLKPDGRTALTRIAQVLAGLPDRRFQVEGHTDNVPIRGARFASNWELSTARALAVVHLMIGGGLRAESISAAGFGEFQPRSGNDTEAGRRLNRRIEIVLLPDLGSFSGLLEPR